MSSLPAVSIIRGIAIAARQFINADLPALLHNTPLRTVKLYSVMLVSVM
jgi:hypothetical protein